MKKASLVIVSVLFSCAAFAQSSYSQNRNKHVRLSYGGNYDEPVVDAVAFRYPRLGESLIDIGYVWDKRSGEMAGKYNFGYGEFKTLNKVDVEASQARMNAQFGFYRGFFAGFDVAYNEIKSQMESNQTGVVSKGTERGIDDPTLQLGYNLSVSSFRIVPSFDYHVKTGDRVVNNSDGNGKSGAEFFQPQIVITNNFDDNMILGGQFSYRHYGTSTAQYKADGFEYSEKSQIGDSYSATTFLEFPGKIHPGVLAQIFKSESGYTQLNANEKKVQGGMTVGAVGVYSQFKISRNFFVIPRAAYTSLLSAEDGTYEKLEKQDGYNVALAARMRF